MSIKAEIARLVAFADQRELPGAWGGQLGSAELRSSPEDFFVAEFSGLQPSGSGEHLMLRIRKTGQNTRWVAKELARILAVPYRSVSYAGMKDRHAVTEQWFSVHLPGSAMPDLGPVQQSGIEILESVWHERKLRPGQLSYNAFKIVLRNLSVTDPERLEQRLEIISRNGVPNYFGPQRFGRNFANLHLASDAMQLKRLNRETRSFALSALRGALFNGYLAQRVISGTWLTGSPDEIRVSDRPRGVAEHDQTVFRPDRFPSGLLWGAASGAGTAAKNDSESDYFRSFPLLTGMLESAGSRAARRSLVARVGNLEWSLDSGSIELQFALGPGCYATTVLRELIDVRDMALGRAA